MEGVRGAHAGNRNWRLSQLYSDAKAQYRQAATAPSVHDNPEIQSLHRKFRLQKDRLIAWGFDWSDDQGSSAEGNIDASVERAGLTEVVSSILENIIQMIDDVEKMRARAAPGAPDAAYPLEKAVTWDDSDRLRYTDLTRDITSSIDLLCDLSRNKQQISSQNKRSEMPEEKRRLADLYSLSNQESYDQTSTTNSSGDASTSALKLNPSRIVMAEEAPPPYQEDGLPCPVRVVGQLRTSESLDSSTIPVLIEYARFDKIYRDNNVPLPLNRVESLSKLLSGTAGDRPAALLDFLGYFEDTSRPRVALVYKVPSWATGLAGPSMKPTSLFDLLHASSKMQPSAATPSVVPALEERYRLASEVANAFKTLMEGEFLHRDVNSNSVSFLPSPNPRRSASLPGSVQYALKKPVLGGFDLFSEYDIDAIPDNLQQNMYRHPDDPRINKGSVGAENYDMRFDVYSIGLVLLEIGLWVPLGDLFKEKYSLNDFSLRLEKIWIPRLASKCGSAFMAATKECVLAGNNAKLSGAALRMTYDRVVSKLSRCCLLDDDSSDSQDDALLPTPTTTLAPLASPSPQRNIDSPPSKRATSIPRKPLPSSKSANSLAGVPDLEPRRRYLSAPSGAYPQAPMEPDFEISYFSRQLREKLDAPPRYAFPFIQIPRDVQDYGRLIAKRLCKIGEKVLDPKETSSIAIHGFGETESTCRPTFCIMCTSTRKFYKAVRKNLKFDDAMFDLIIIKGDVVRSKSNKVFRSDARSGVRHIEEIHAKNPGHHPRPLCGASIGAWKDFEHLPPVSFGGLVMVDDQYFGMTVHHMLEAPEDDDEDEEQLNELRKSSAAGPPMSRSIPARQDSAFTIDSAISHDNLSDAFSEESDSDAESMTFSDIEDDDDAMSLTSDGADDGDTEGIPVGRGPPITITQPALADVAEDFFPVEEDKDDDHLDSHTFGQLYASSGLRRLNMKGARHEIDWALFKLDQGRAQPCNVVAGGRRYYRGSQSSDASKAPKLRAPVCRKPFLAHEDHYPASIHPSEEFGGLPVHCFGRTSGLSTGRIGTVMEYVKMTGRSTWSESWVVHAMPSEPRDAADDTIPGLGVPGDSGAWIIDNKDGKVCGHVLAWSEKKRVAYIAPMDVMIADIKKTIGAKSIYLPGQEVTAIEEIGKYDACVPAERVLNSRHRGESDDATRSIAADQDVSEVEGIGRSSEVVGLATMSARPGACAGDRSLMKQGWAARHPAVSIEATS